ncbi:zincin-like metallopeptidase toxin domain-containing protein [Brevibacillus brevis]|uniref:zincin-like metallopeptidase toxin domain-containing protein n=2 Tax=Brevibacillus brevis TaxID=1393 RepID=UPI0027D9C38B|nr:zincin-like metallopeptidase toxin domain-containing protein [Brevibacillus brevis]
MWDHFVKGISKLGDVPAAMQKAASELPGALEKAAEDLPKGIGVFVREGYIEPMQEDLDTLRDDKLNLADGIALGGLALNALTLGRSKNIKNVVDVTRKGKRANDKIDYVEETGRLGGTLYNDKDLRLLGNYLEKRGVTLKVGDEFLPPGKGGGFNYNTDELVLRSNPTQYEVWHELSHYLHYRRIGKDAYSNLPRTYGPVPMNDLTQFNAPEQFVYDMLSNSPKRWNSLNEAEQLHANWYIMQYGGLR